MNNVKKQRKLRLKKYEAIPFVNELDHTINVGDNVLIVTSAWKRVSVNIGRYLGVRNPNTNDARVIVECDRTREYDVHNETGEPWSYYVTIPGLVAPQAPRYPDITYSWGKTPEQKQQEEQLLSEYKQKRAEYDKLNDEFNLKRAIYRKENYHKIVENYVVRRTLMLNRIYPLTMKVSELVKASF